MESDAIGTVGVGEATIPTMRTFHRLLGIDEREFMAATQATFKLGIQFENWGQQRDRYIHSFGEIGQRSWMAEFHEFWLAAQGRLGVWMNTVLSCKLPATTSFVSGWITSPSIMLII